MKLAGFLLLPAGWIIVLAAVALLPTGPPQQGAFVLAGVLVEPLGVDPRRSFPHRRAWGSRVNPFIAPEVQVACFILTLLVPCAPAGIAIINAGLGRSRNAAHSMLSSLCVMAVAAIAFFAVGYSWQGSGPQTVHAIFVNGKPWSWLGTAPFLLRGMDLEHAYIAIPVLLSIFGVAFAAMIPLGSGADRWRLGAACASAAIMGAWTFPLFAHWAWRGWLSQLGSNYGIGMGFLDCGGAGVIQTVGGLTARQHHLALGPRRGKYTPGGMPTALPGHNAVLTVFGCFWHGSAGWV